MPTPVARCGSQCDRLPVASTPMRLDPRPAAPPSAEASKKLARGSNRFGLDLFGKLREQKGNLVFSPASVSTALAMTCGSARGATPPTS